MLLTKTDSKRLFFNNHVFSIRFNESGKISEDTLVGSVGILSVKKIGYKAIRTPQVLEHALVSLCLYVFKLHPLTFPL